ncbi:MAG: hypothetical protein IJ333_01980 [Clostridia bacterium]|nr:hypothetical protein [Clostridia bacterium]
MESQRHLQLKTGRKYLNLWMILLLYFGTFSLITKYGPKNEFVSYGGLCFILFLPIFAAFFGSYSYKILRRIVLPHVAFILFLVVFTLFGFSSPVIDSFSLLVSVTSALITKYVLNALEKTADGSPEEENLDVKD